jgi:hypothetical protein
VIVIAGAAEEEAPDEDSLRARAAALRAQGMSAREVMRVLMDTAHAPRNVAYRLAHE